MPWLACPTELVTYPSAIATTPVSLLTCTGATVAPLKSHTVPSDLRARLSYAASAIAVTPARLLTGTGVRLLALSPQTQTAPSDVKARLPSAPPLTAIAFV